MITVIEEKKLFHLQTKHSSYLFHVLPTGHVSHVYFGSKLDTYVAIDPYIPKHPLEFGSQVLYSPEHKPFSLNTSLLEVSSFGKGDYRSPALEIRFPDGSSLFDLKFKSYDILQDKPLFPSMPETRMNQASPLETLVIHMFDSIQGLSVDLYYHVFEEMDCFSRRTVIINTTNADLSIHKAMSLQLDFVDDDYEFISLNGTWIRERHINRFPIQSGVFSVDSKKGVSSSDHNPFVMLTRKHTTEETGEAIGVGLVWSGDFLASVEVSPHHFTRLLMGLNSFDFEYHLKSNERFITPEAIFSYTSNGLASLSHSFHDCIEQHIISETWRHHLRPIAINNWEATYFDFTEAKLFRLAKKAQQLGIELFVLDDGWFGKRDDDTSSLGDWTAHRKKLPKGLAHFANKIRHLGLEFGLWVEPEMVSVDSDLYRKHPNWAIQHPKSNPSFGRNQLVLDCTNPEVCDYIVSSISQVLQESKAIYCKWDMNRNLSDCYSLYLSKEQNSALRYHYVLGLYSILDRLTKAHPNVLFESCASGGNRFDMGMLYYMPQTWTSDNTDALERLYIQYGTSMIYPPSTISNHVSNSPNAQVIRTTSIESRFQVAMFGVLGYELDVTRLSSFELKAIREQIAFYKLHRETLQFGRFSRQKNPFQANEALWMMENKHTFEAIALWFQILQKPNYGFQLVRFPQLSYSGKVRIKNRPIYLNLRVFGDLIKHALPIKVKAHSNLFNTLSNHYRMLAEADDFIQDAFTIRSQGFFPKVPYVGTGYHKDVRLMGDFGSRVYTLTPIREDD